jgi:hypothetical protein
LPNHIRFFDRGYNSNIVTEKLLDSGVKLIVRTTDVCHVVHKGKTLPTSGLVEHFIGKYVLDFQSQKGEKQRYKISIVPIELPKFPGVTLQFVV